MLSLAPRVLLFQRITINAQGTIRSFPQPGSGSPEAQCDAYLQSLRLKGRQWMWHAHVYAVTDAGTIEVDVTLDLRNTKLRRLVANAVLQRAHQNHDVGQAQADVDLAQALLGSLLATRDLPPILQPQSTPPRPDLHLPTLVRLPKSPTWPCICGRGAPRLRGFQQGRTIMLPAMHGRGGRLCDFAAHAWAQVDAQDALPVHQYGPSQTHPDRAAWLQTHLTEAPTSLGGPFPDELSRLMEMRP